MNIQFYMIHCKIHTEREENILHINSLLPNLEIFMGINTLQNKMDITNKELFFKTYDDNYEFINNALSKPGELGCYLSHQSLLNLIAKGNEHKYSVILEDDIELNNHFLKKLENIINDVENINLDWDIIYLGNIGKNHDKQIVNNIYSINPNQICCGTHCLLINNKNAKKIYDSNLKIRHAIDHQLKYSIDNKIIEGYAIFPIVCKQNKVFKSNIQ